MFTPSAAVQIVADSPAQLRRSDVFRLLDSFEDRERGQLARWLRKERHDLVDEIDDALEELECDELADNPLPRYRS